MKGDLHLMLQAATTRKSDGVHILRNQRLEKGRFVYRELHESSQRETAMLALNRR